MMSFQPPSDYCLATQIRVRYSETDQMGVVYNANHLIWFEIARTEYCRAQGLAYSLWEERAVFLPVSEAHCRYKRPARYDDRINLYCRIPIHEVKVQSVRFDYLISQVLDSGEEALLAEGWTKHGIVDSNGRLYRKNNPFTDWLLNLLG